MPWQLPCVLWLWVSLSGLCRAPSVADCQVDAWHRPGNACGSCADGSCRPGTQLVGGVMKGEKAVWWTGLSCMNRVSVSGGF